MAVNLKALKNDVIRERNCGITTFQVVERSSKATSLTGDIDRFVEQLGFERLGKNWIEINKEEAQTLATSVLHHDLAYNGPIMDFERAHELAKGFLALFSDGTHFFTNGRSGVLASGGTYWQGSSISRSTFDKGVVCIDTTLLGILWVEDED